MSIIITVKLSLTFLLCICSESSSTLPAMPPLCKSMCLLKYSESVNTTQQTNILTGFVQLFNTVTEPRFVELSSIRWCPLVVGGVLGTENKHLEPLSKRAQSSRTVKLLKLTLPHLRGMNPRPWDGREITCYYL